MRGQRVVVIQEESDVAFREGQGRIAGRSDPAGRGQRDRSDAPFAIEAPQEAPDLLRGRAVVGDAKHPIVVDLIAHGLNRGPQIRGLGITDRQDDRDAWETGHPGQPGADPALVRGPGLVAADPGLVGAAIGSGGAALGGRPHHLQRLCRGHAGAAERVDQTIAADRAYVQVVRRMAVVVDPVDPRPAGFAAKGDQAWLARTDLGRRHASAAGRKGHDDGADVIGADQHPVRPNGRLAAVPGLETELRSVLMLPAQGHAGPIPGERGEPSLDVEQVGPGADALQTKDRRRPEGGRWQVVDEPGRVAPPLAPTRAQSAGPGLQVHHAGGVGKA